MIMGKVVAKKRGPEEQIEASLQEILDRRLQDAFADQTIPTQCREKLAALVNLPERLVDAETYELAGMLVVDVLDARKKIEELYEPYADALHQAHRRVTGARAEAIEPYDLAVKSARAKRKDYETIERERARLEQERLNREAEARRREEQRLRDEVALRESQERERLAQVEREKARQAADEKTRQEAQERAARLDQEAADALTQRDTERDREDAMPVAEIIFEAKALPDTKRADKREVWKAKVTDLAVLMSAAASNDMLLDMLAPGWIGEAEKALKPLAVRQHEAFNIPGVVAVKE